MKPMPEPAGRALVTGGAGFIGAHLCARLLEDGWTVVAVDNLSTGNEHAVERFSGTERFSFHRADIVRETLPGGPVDVLFQLASPASPIAYARLPIETLEANAMGTRRCLEFAKASEARFVLASTSEVYGDPLVHPQSETYFGNVDPVGPRSMYDEGKRFAEALATWYGRVHDLDVRIARIFNTYGPGMSLRDGRVVPTFVRQALAGEPLTVHGEGNQTRSLCYVADLVEALVRLSSVDRSAVGSGPVNLGNPMERSVLEIARAILALTRSASPIEHVDRPPADPERRCPDISRARQILGWEPRVGLEEGLRRTIEWAEGSAGRRSRR